MAAPGPSLTSEVAEAVYNTAWPVIACQDAHRLMPWADVLYGCDARWWETYEGVPEFKGEKWSTHGDASNNDKREVAEKYGVNMVHGAPQAGFSYDPELIHYGDNSGFQALNLAILMGCTYIVLVGYNMGGRGHFFGDHPQPLFNQDDYAKWVPKFNKAAEVLPEHIKIVNATPDSMLKCFPCMPLSEALENGRLYWHRTVINA